MTVAIQFENVSKQYRLGQVGTGTLSHDLQRAWARLRGQPDPFAKVGAVNNREQAGGEYVWALNDVNFEVPQGEILGIIGRNGAGKSTLLKLLSRVTTPTTGSIRARGRIASLLEVGTGFHPELTGRENIFLNGAILGMTRAEITARLEEIVEFSGCAKYIDTPVKRYSSGMTVRLGFAVAAHLECEILVVDEVLAVGDVEFQNKCLSKMKSLISGGRRTVIFVSHNLSSIRSLCTRCVWIHRGTIQLEGVPDDVLKSYVSSTLDNQTTIDTRMTGPLSTKGLIRSICIEGRTAENYVTEVVDSTSLKIRIEISGHLDETVESALAWFADDIRLCSLIRPLLSSNHGQYEAVFEMPSRLFKAGRYRIGVGLTDRKNRSLWGWCENAFAIEILNDPPGAHKLARDLINVD